MVKKKRFKPPTRSAVKYRAASSTPYSATKRRPDLIAKKTIIIVICLSIIIVAVAIACHFLLNEEKLVKDRTKSLAQEYYEGYIYENLIHGAMDQAEIEQVMDKYTLRGFAPVYLRQLLLSSTTDVNHDLIAKHCDENTTFVKFYPEAPFDKESYRLEFSYDCDF